MYDEDFKSDFKGFALTAFEASPLVSRLLLYRLPSSYGKFTKIFENAPKHGVDSQGKSSIHPSLTTEDKMGCLFMRTVENFKEYIDGNKNGLQQAKNSTKERWSINITVASLVAGGGYMSWQREKMKRNSDTLYIVPEAKDIKKEQGEPREA